MSAENRKQELNFPLTGLFGKPATEVESADRSRHLGMNWENDIAGHLLEANLVDGLKDCANNKKKSS